MLEIKKKWTNKGLDKQYVAVLFCTQYNSLLSSSLPKFRILSQVVAEESLTEKKIQTDRQTAKHSYRKGKNYIPPIYFVRGYNQNKEPG